MNEKTCKCWQYDSSAREQEWQVKIYKSQVGSPLNESIKVGISAPHSSRMDIKTVIRYGY